MMAQCRICYCIALFLFLNCYPTTAQPPYDYPTANLSTTWNNTGQFIHFSDPGISIRPILLRGTSGIKFACGFYCDGNCTSYLFAVYLVETDYTGDIIASGMGYPQVVWSANRDSPVSIGAILNFTETGELVFKDVNGSTVWTTNTTGKAVVGMNLTDEGNLVLFDVNSSVVWQSFDYPTDCLVMGQRLYQGQQLIPSVSSTNWMAQKGLFALQVTNESLVAYVGSNPPQVYYQHMCIHASEESTYVWFMNGALSFFFLVDDPELPNYEIPIPEASSAQYMKFMPNGHLKVFEWKDLWSEVADNLLTDGQYGECTYPFTCGRNAICSSNQQCRCPVSNSPEIDYFKPVDDGQLNQGCSAINPLTCNATQDNVFIPLNNVSIYNHSPADRENVSMENCKHACLNNCSCKAAVFHPYLDPSHGRCYLPSDPISMIRVVELDAPRINASTFIKVQNVNSTPPYTPQLQKEKSQHVAVVITSIIVSIFVLLVVVGFITFKIRKLRSDTQMEEEFIDAVLGMPTRYTYEELKAATDNFRKKLGQGGFGSVFEGTLADDSKIAVKCLDGLGHANKSFLAEVESIGSIHHVNLVKLMGFCAWKSQRFLVYAFMGNGSLDKWIYHGVREQILEWQCRKKIILDIAKGLAYLHEECTQKIIHLDIKPQNILLDKYFNAKVSDFGLSKLIDRNQSQVMTRMRGTPGYMAPEWLSSVITEKVDVYSFGVVLLEILCGRKNFDRSQPEESWHLLGIFQKCWEQEALLDIVDKYSEDMQTHGQEVVEMMKVASWCLQTNFTRRPSMSVVVKVLEGVMNVESNLDYNFTDPRLQNKAVEHERDLTPVLASPLSGPR
ncbi:G-type lectin S-receptor-like serine/threonine-protein kinase SD2-5 [Bidens hawaiensis]|uniref:G-type lectin S-receptor-like serine/threonine-protein kinase SD2-5 n=1 Tax=Bidens hawaiensis TaxID=980011 RepID=UPI00404B68F0